MKHIFWWFAALVLGFWGALAGFGLLLALFWASALSQHVDYKMATAVSSAAAAFILGGMISSWVNGRYPIQTGILFSFFAGLITFGYLFGLDFRLLLMLPTSTLLGALGGLLVSKTKQPIQWRKT